MWKPSLNGWHFWFVGFRFVSFFLSFQIILKRSDPKKNSQKWEIFVFAVNPSQESPNVGLMTFNGTFSSDARLRHTVVIEVGKMYIVHCRIDQFDQVDMIDLLVGNSELRITNYLVYYESNRVFFKFCSKQHCMMIELQPDKWNCYFDNFIRFKTLSYK